MEAPGVARGPGARAPAQPRARPRRAARGRLERPGDVEALHDFRVALRRLRSWERACRPHLGKTVPKRLRVLLRQLALLEPGELPPHGSAELLHRALEATKLAFADREAWYGDPDFTEVPLADLLSGDAGNDVLISDAGSDLLAGGVPCPPFSIAGKQLRHSDERALYRASLDSRAGDLLKPLKKRPDFRLSEDLAVGVKFCRQWW